MGYNPKKPDRPSYHPLFCFIGETRDFLHGIFRTRKAHTSRGVKRFVDECLKKISEGIREIYLRADSGFYDSDFLYYLEKNGILYAIVVKLYPWIQMELVGLKLKDIGGGVSVGEMWYMGIGWKAPRRMVVIREEEKEKEVKRNKGEKSFYGEACSIDRKGVGIMVFQLWIETKNGFFQWRMAVGEKIFLDKEP